VAKVVAVATARRRYTCHTPHYITRLPLSRWPHSVPRARCLCFGCVVVVARAFRSSEFVFGLCLSIVSFFILHNITFTLTFFFLIFHPEYFKLEFFHPVFEFKCVKSDRPKDQRVRCVPHRITSEYMHLYST